MKDANWSRTLTADGKRYESRKYARSTQRRSMRLCDGKSHSATTACCEGIAPPNFELTRGVVAHQTTHNRTMLIAAPRSAENQTLPEQCQTASEDSRERFELERLEPNSPRRENRLPIELPLCLCVRCTTLFIM